MPTASWPATLPNYVDSQGYQETLGRNVAVFEPDVSTVPMQREVTTFAPDTIQRTMDVTGAELLIFRNFYQVTLKSGTLPFTFSDPVLGVTCTYYFDREPPVVSHIGGQYYTVAFKLLRFPS